MATRDIDFAKVLDHNLNPTGAIAKHQWNSFIWTERYQDPGQFEMRLWGGAFEALSAADEYLGKFLRVPVSTETMLIEKVRYEGTRSDPYVTLTGRSAEVVLEQRILKEMSFPYGVPAYSLLEQAWDWTIGKDAQAARQIPQFIMDSPDHMRNYIDYAPDGKTLYDFLLYVARYHQNGLRTRFHDENQLAINFYRTRDLTGKGSGNPVFFTDTTKTLVNLVYEKDLQKHRNIGYVYLHGAHDDANTSVWFEVDNGAPNGIQRREGITQPQITWTKAAFQTYEQKKSLTSYGLGYIYEHQLYDQIEGEAPSNNVWVYGDTGHYYLGDWVMLGVRDKQQRCRVLEYTHAWTADQGYRGYPRLEPMPRT